MEKIDSWKQTEDLYSDYIMHRAHTSSRSYSKEKRKNTAPNSTNRRLVENGHGQRFAAKTPTGSLTVSQVYMKDRKRRADEQTALDAAKRREISSDNSNKHQPTVTNTSKTPKAPRTGKLGGNRTRNTVDWNASSSRGQNFQYGKNDRLARVMSAMNQLSNSRSSTIKLLNTRTGNIEIFNIRDIQLVADYLNDALSPDDIVEYMEIPTQTRTDIERYIEVLDIPKGQLKQIRNGPLVRHSDDLYRDHFFS